MAISFLFQKRRIFWKLRNIFKKGIFSWHNFSLSAREKIQSFYEQASIQFELTMIVLWSCLSALVLISCFELTEYVCVAYFGPKIAIVKILKNNILLNATTLDQVLTTLASISGVLLGLYFTAISVVAGAVFAKVPSDLRNYLVKEKVGNIYIKSLASLLAISLILLGTKLLGYHPGLLIVVYVVALACFSVFGFAVIGLRAFFFLDPTTLADLIIGDLIKNINLATTKGIHWDDESFQNHYRRRASQTIGTLGVLANICQQEVYLHGAPQSIILQKILHLLSFYQKSKRFIPTESKWFALMPYYHDWFVANSPGLTIALQTHTSLQPELKPNNYWFEDELLKLVFEDIKRAFEKGDFSMAINIIEPLDHYLELLGEDLELERSREICERFQQNVFPCFENLPAESSKHYDQTIMGLFDRYKLAPISSALGFFKFCRSFKMEKINQSLKTISWRKLESIYSVSYPPIMLDRMEFLQKRLLFEQNVEGEIVSPNWYKKQQIAIKYGRLVKLAVNTVAVLIEKYHINEVNSLIKKGRYILAVMGAKRGLELIFKIRANFEHVEAVVDALKTSIVEKGLPLDEFDRDGIHSKLEQYSDALIVQLAQCLYPISEIKRSDQEPDLFGEIYTTLCQQMFVAIKNAKTEQIKSVFPVLFVDSLNAFDKLRKTYKDQKPETVILISAEPLLDMLQLSGYAKVYSELLEKPELWKIFEEIWNKYLDGLPEKNRAIELLINTYKFQIGRRGLFERDLWKTNWELELNHQLRHMGLIDDMFSSASWREARVEHKSPLVRALCWGKHEPFIKAEEIFILTYLLPKYDGGKVDFRDDHNFLENIEKENNRNNDAEEG